MIRIANENLRKTIRVVVPFLLFPLAVALGVFVFPENSYAWVTVVCLIFAMLLFYASFDKKVVGTRRMVIIAVMTESQNPYQPNFVVIAIQTIT